MKHQRLCAFGCFVLAYGIWAARDARAGYPWCIVGAGVAVVAIALALNVIARRPIAVTRGMSKLREAESKGAAILAALADKTTAPRGAGEQQ